MDDFPASRILRDDFEVISNGASEELIAEAGSLTAFLKQCLETDEAELQTIIGRIQSNKRRLEKEAANLTKTSDRNLLLKEADNLESLRQQLLAAFIAKQSAYQILMNIEQNLAKRWSQKEKAAQSPVPNHTPRQAKNSKKRVRASRRR